MYFILGRRQRNSLLVRMRGAKTRTGGASAIREGEGVTERVLATQQKNELLLVVEFLRLAFKKISVLLQLFVYFQFSAARFSNLIKRAFFQCGYTKDFPGVFQTPLEYCFEEGLTEECFHENSDQPAFIKCAHCENCLCIDHAVIADLHIFASDSVVK